MPDTIEPLYGKTFFSAQSFASLQSARLVLPELLRHTRPRSMVDIGCGVGSWLRAAGDLGVGERLGVDGDYVDRNALMIEAEQFMPADLSKPGLADMIAERRPGRFDLVACLEVAEHLPFDRSFSLVDDLCALSDLVLFSAAIPFQHGTGHINEQWPEFWATQFRSHGYACFDLLRPQIWSRPDIDWWYSQNTLVFARQGSEAHDALPADTVVGVGPLARVHPEAWLSGALNVWHRHRAAAREEEVSDYRALVRAWTRDEGLTPPLRAVERARTAAHDARDVFPYTRTEVDEPERLLAESEARGNATRADLAAAQRDCNGLRTDLAQAQIRITALEAECEAERRRAEKLTADLEAKGEAIAALQSGAETDRARATELAETSSALQAQLAKLRSELDEHKLLAEELATTSKSWETKALSLGMEFDSERSQSGLVAATLRESRQEIETLRAKFDAERARGEALHVELGRARYEIERLHGERDQAQAELLSIQEKLVALDARAATLQAANTTLRGMVLRHDIQMQEAFGRIAVMDQLQHAYEQMAAQVQATEQRAAADVAAERHRADTLLASTSWRITAPVRALKRLVG